MNKKLLNVLSIFLITFSLVSCFDPIFYTVTVETPLLEPLIDGSPTNFVILNKEMYVASGKNIWKYNGSSTWNIAYSLKHRITSLAATSKSLYALYLENDTTGKIYNCATSEEGYLNLSDVQSIHALDNVLFASVKDEKDNTYINKYFDEGNPSPDGFKDITGASSSSVLCGVAYDSKYYYLCSNSGIFYLDKTLNSSAAQIPDISGFTGIINLNDNYVAAITKNGKIYQISDAAATEKVSFSDSRYATGALALYQKDGVNLLLISRHEAYSSSTTAYTNGYVELSTDATGLIVGTSFANPGNAPASSSIDNYDRYSSSLGKKVINYIIQTPSSVDPNRTLFVSTQQNGVWSYRDRGDGNGQTWNAEQ